MTTVTESVPTGNTFDKYGSTNPVVPRLMSRFERTLERVRRIELQLGVEPSHYEPGAARDPETGQTADREALEV